MTIPLRNPQSTGPSRSFKITLLKVWTWTTWSPDSAYWKMRLRQTPSWLFEITLTARPG
ncbi:uncharacterized protein PGTG_21177 [Puccinia graminis f. sp. tritici CRL 75-36-700-3]|uniref:Uncharacterized protein n=1 Tax=Puccinia graminis f. sp. tritici (strain CRL 75-36-700-3 / race SCCL) TaxID=418459 RepID=H6QQL7_PUCGT|nr:uncharacterized protein PGTG_21177 [Puccinia graminis f. sp. tritici CRL 75-36-700-3]EHS62669.1 hypothetical protein PGTG_21177 [Puccinia graminis f. sp. tritici CRL 75-36-700-3]